ncbi:MAG TPA: hypothetical protein VLV82_05635 [Candidatus Angelobacter sp.]|nr:hypothetical protein [Candidatus Angelobacter sp.]
MSTDTSQRPAAGQPVRTGRSLALTVVLIVVATLSVVAVVAYAYGFTELYGGETESGLPVWVPLLLLAVVPGLLGGWAVQRGVETFSTHGRPRYLRVAPVAVALVAVAVAGGALVGGQVHDTNAATASAACTTQDVAVLDGLLHYAPDSTPAEGQSDGRCMAWLIYPGEDGAALMTTLTADLAADGWITDDVATDARIFTRDGQTVLVEHVRSSEGSTAFSLTAVK